MKSLKQKGNQLYKEGHFGMAAKMYQKYVSKPHEDNKNAYCNMGLCYFKQERYEECIQACKQALRIDDNYAKVYYRLALAYDKIGNQYQCFANADQFCRISKQNKQSTDYKEMRELKERDKTKLMYPCPLPIEEKNKLFYPNFDINPQSKIKDSGSTQNNKEPKDEYFGGDTWVDVQGKIDQQQYKYALDMSYGIIRSSKQPKQSQLLNKQNFKKVKEIKSGRESNSTKLYTDTSQLPQQRQLQENTKQKLNPPTCSIENVVNPLESKTDEDGYTKYFVRQLESKPDVFEGFAVVIMQILKNPSIKCEEVEGILMKASKDHPMFMVLQLSLSEKQKQEIRKLLSNAKVTNKLIDVYCS